MKWFNSTPKYGEERIIHDFLFFPQTISGETRWLEFASWRERWQDWCYEINKSIDAERELIKQKKKPKRFIVKCPRGAYYWERIEWIDHDITGNTANP